MTMRVRRILLTGTFFAFAAALLFLLAPVVPLPYLVIAGVVAVAVGAVAMATDLSASRATHAEVLWPRRAPPAPPAPLAGAAGPYRGVRPPPVDVSAPPASSARRTALVIAACLAFTALAVPFSLHLPRWIEVEAVFAGWWVVWAVVLTIVARRGARLADDHEIAIRLPWSRAKAAPRAPMPSPAERATPASSIWGKIFDLFTFASDLESIVFALALVIVLGAALLSAWLVIELVAPLLFGLAYLGVVRALRRATDYRGSTARAGLAAVAWATAYVAPLAGLVWVLHEFAGRG